MCIVLSIGSNDATDKTKSKMSTINSALPTDMTAADYADYLDRLAAKITEAAAQIRSINAGAKIEPIFAEFGADATPLTVEDVNYTIKNVVKQTLAL
jgi:hypothetical protein